MTDEDKTKEQLIQELAELRQRAGDMQARLQRLEATDTERLPSVSVLERLEEELRKSQALFRQAERMGNLGHWEWDHINDRLVSCSEQFARIYGMTVDEALEFFSNWESEFGFVHPDDRVRYEQHRVESDKQQEGMEIEFRISTPSGAVRHVYLQSENVLDDQGRLIKSFGTVQDITSRKQADAILRESEARFQQLAEAIDIVFVLSDVSSNSILYANPAYEQIWGRRVQDLYEFAVEWDEGVHPDDRGPQQESYERMLENGESHTDEFRVVHTDGSTRWVQSTSYPLLDESGQVYRVAGIVQDITARKQQGEALRESEERFRQLADGVEDVFAITDVQDNTILYASPAYEQIWGRRLQHLYEDAGEWDAGIHPDDRLRIQDSWARMMEHGGRYTEEYRVVHTDGSMRWVRSRAYPLRDEAGKVYRAVEIAQDVTARKKQEEALRESEERFRQLADGVEDVFAITDVLSGSILYASPAYEQIWGRPVQHLYEDAGEWDAGIHPDHRLRIQDSWARMVEHGESYTEEYQVIHTDGSTRWVRSRAYPLRDEVGKVYRAVEIAQDVTARKQQEEALRESEERFRQLADGIEDVFAISDVESWSVLYASPAYEKVWGRPVQHLYEDAGEWDAGIHPEDRVRIQDSWVRMLEQGERYEEQYRVVHPDGSIRWVRDRAFPVRDESGQPIRIAEIVQDITARKQQEEELRESETRFRQLADGIEDVFAITDVQSESILYVSSAYEQIWGRSLQELYEDGGEWDAGIHPDDRVRIQESWARMKEQGSRYEEEFRVIHTDGSMRWVRDRAFPVRDESGQLYRVAEIVQDISARKQAEDELHKSQTLYSQAERMGKMGHWEWDHTNDRLASCSEQFAQNYEMSVDEALAYFSNRESELILVHPDDRERYEQHIDESEEQLKGSDIEYRIITRSGAVRHVHLQTEAVLDDEGRLIKTFGIVQDITDRKQIAQKLIESNERFSQLSDNIEDVFWLIDFKDPENPEVLFTSPAFERIWQRPALGFHQDLDEWYEWIHPDDKERVLTAFTNFAKGNADYDLEFRIIRPDGTMRTIADQANLIRDENGKIIRSAGISRDITERKQQEEELQESESRFRQLADGIEDVFILSDLENMSVLYASPAYEQIWGRPVQELYEDYRQWDAGIHPDDLAHVLDSWSRMLEQGEIYESEYRVIHTDGSMRWVRVRAFPVRDESGKIYRVAEIVQDITARKQQEEELQESETRFRQLANAIDDLFVVTDVQSGSILYANPAYEQIWGRPVQSLYEDHKQWDEGVHPDDRTRTRQAWLQMVEHGERFDEEYRVIRPDGSMSWVRSEHYPVRDKSGRVYRVAEIVQDITERKEKEEALRESESRFSQLAEAVEDVFVISDAKSGSILYANLAYEKIWGRPVQELYEDYRIWADAIHPDDRLRLLEAWEHVKERGGRYEEDYRVIHPDGSIRRVRSRIYPVLDESGQVYRVAEVVQDITALKQQEEELRESETRFRQLADGIEDVFAITDVQSEAVLYASPAYEQIWGRPVQELYEDAGQWDEAIHPDDRVRIQDSWTRMLEQGEHYEEDYRVIRPDGSIRRVRSRIYPLIDGSDQIYRVAEVVQDITAHRQAEEKLIESNQRFSQISKYIEDVFWLMDVEDVRNVKVLFVSPAFEPIWQRTAAELYQDPAVWDESIYAEDKERVITAFRNFAQGNGDYDLEYRIVRPDNTTRTIAVHGNLIRDENGKIIRAAGVGRDITRRKRAEEALQSANVNLAQAAIQAQELASAAEKANRAKDEFLANTSHELRTPLTGIIGFLQIVDDDLCDSPEEEREFVHLALKSGYHLLRVVNDVLDISSIEAGNLRLQIEEVDLARVLDNVADVAAVQAREKGIRLIFDSHPELYVQADSVRLQQALSNLVTNAIKNTDKGEVTVSTQPDADSGYALIEVVDTGSGIAPEVLPHMFEKFVQGNRASSNAIGGTGLGLAITRSLVEMMDGQAGLESEGEGHGARAWLKVPMASVL